MWWTCIIGDIDVSGISYNLLLNIVVKWFLTINYLLGRKLSINKLYSYFVYIIKSTGFFRDKFIYFVIMKNL